MNARPFARSGLPAASDLRAAYDAQRRRTLDLTAALSAEDATVQAMPDASPAKWHLAHTTWFFETFVLKPYLPGYAEFDPRYAYLFNSYYEAIGARQPRAERGMLTRPSLAEVVDYRAHVDRHMQLVFDCGTYPGLDAVVHLGIAHEEQHQELLLMDILCLFAQSPLKPAYAAEPAPAAAQPAASPARFRGLQGGLVEIGADDDGFAFDNERPRHRVWLEPFEIADRLVTNAQWLAFIDDGGYSRAELWLADGWALLQAQRWQAPLYWQRGDAGWNEFTLHGLRALEPSAAVAHVSYYEAAAYARWANARLPTEAEWETAAAAGCLRQVGDVLWQWTASAYAPYPGFCQAAGALGEYNGRFRVNQIVLRGGAAATPPGHTRVTYRNFYAPDKRWLFGGVRLARDVARASDTAPAPRRSADSEFARHVVAGLSRPQKALSPKYFYDAEGSRLFEAICRTPEYYLTRSETALLRAVAAALAQSFPADAVLIEFGSGASEKTRVLLDAARAIHAYVPVDISRDALADAAGRIAVAYPRLRVLPVVADFMRPFRLPEVADGRARIGFFPGSTIGNLSRDEAVEFLRGTARLLGSGARLVLGVDLVKGPEILLAAYDDAQGVTARFNRNLLVRINRELGGSFDPASFDHLALWNAERERIEMHLVSRADQIVQAAGHSFVFKAGERLHTENSHKFTIDSLTRLADAAGWCVARHWVAADNAFAIFELSVDARAD